MDSSFSYINRIVWQYCKSCLFILVGLTLLALFYMSTSQRLLTPQIITTLAYNVVISGIIIFVWKTIMTYSKESIIQFYLGITGLRFISAIIVIFIYCINVEELYHRLEFAIIFCTYYIVMLIFDTIFFIKKKTLS